MKNSVYSLLAGLRLPEIFKAVCSGENMSNIKIERTGRTTSEIAQTESGNLCEQATIRERAYQLWEQAGSPEGDGVAFWVEAERQLVSDWGARLTSEN